MLTKHVYTGCNKKLAAREETIFNTYRKLFQTNCLPSNKQFVSLCGLCCDVDKGNIILKDSELDHILREKFVINPSQYHGIDSNTDTILANEKIVDFVDAEDKPSWYNQYFSLALNQISRESTFNPGVINFDSIVMPEKGMTNIKQIVKQTRNIKNVLLVCNLVTKSRDRVCTPEELFELIHSSGLKQLFNETNWILVDDVVYSYQGTGKRSKTTMTTFVAYKKE